MEPLKIFIKEYVGEKPEVKKPEVKVVIETPYHFVYSEPSPYLQYAPNAPSFSLQFTSLIKRLP